MLGLFSLFWLVDFVLYSRLLSAAGSLDLDLYRFYSVGAVLGWVAGNIFELRRWAVQRRTLLLIYLIGPMSFVLLLRALASSVAQEAAPFVPLYALAIYALFFLVPVSLQATRATRG